MPSRPAPEIRKTFLDDQAVMAKLVDSGNSSRFWSKLSGDSEKALSNILELTYEGKKVREVPEFKEAKKLTDRLFGRVWRIYWRAAAFPLNPLMVFDDVEYAISLLQGMDVVGLFKQTSGEMDRRIKGWFVLGLYAFEYELSAKALICYMNVMTAKDTYTQAGDVVNLLKGRYRITELNDYFEPFLRNAIDHSQYTFTDEKFDTIEAWNVVDGKKTPTRRYGVASVFNMIVRLLFFILAYLCSWYELVMELKRKGAFK